MTQYYYSRVRILTFTVLVLLLSFVTGIYLVTDSNSIFSFISGILLILSGIGFIALYRRIIVAVLKRNPALSITPMSIQCLGTKKFSWDDIEYYRLRYGVLKSSIEIKLYDNKEDAIRLNRSIRKYFDKLPLRSFNKSILIVDLTFIIGADEYIIQSFEKYDLIGQESQRMAS